MSNSAVSISEQAARALEDLAIPQALQSNLDRHHANLTQLASALLDTGMDEGDVEKTINTAVQSFRDELVATILSLKEHDSEL